MGKDRDTEGGIYSADSRIDRDIDANISRVKTLFADWGDVVERRFTVRRTGMDVYAEDTTGSADETSTSVGAIYVVYIDGLCDNGLIEDTIIKPVTWEWRHEHGSSLWEAMDSFETQSADIKAENDFKNVMFSILKGDTAVFVSDADQAFVVSSCRYVEWKKVLPKVECVVRGIVLMKASVHRQRLSGEESKIPD